MATIGIHYVSAALKGAQRHGFDESALLRAAGINQQLLEMTGSRVNEIQMTRLIQTIWREMKDEFMGFTARPCKNGVFALMAETVRHASNLESLLRVGLHFYNLFSDDIKMTLDTDGNQVELSVTFTHPELDPDHFYREFWLLIWHRFPSWYIGESIHLTEAHLDYPRPKYMEELLHIFPCPLRFDQARCRLIFQLSYLNKPLVRSTIELQKFLANSPADFMTIPGENHSLSTQIQRLILNTQDNYLQFPKFEELARMVGMSPQTLHRRLVADGSSYQRIKNSIRRDIAIRKLGSGKCSVSELSRITGFNEPSSFTRAFKQWTGVSPRNYKKK